MIRIDGDYGEIDAEFERLNRMPTGKARRALDDVLKFGYQISNDSTHVITGSLKSSEKLDTNTSKATHEWQGTITWGGPSAGPNNPVDYAIYEKRRGGTHDFTEILTVLDRLFVLAMKRGLSKGD